MSLFDKRSSPRATRCYRPCLESLEDRLCPTHVLAAPTVLGLTVVSPTQVTLTWSSVPNETGYHVLQWNGNRVITVATVGPGVTTDTLSGMPAGHTLWLRVEAFTPHATADSAWESVLLPSQPITPVTGLTATAISTSEIDLSWIEGQGATGYRVYQWHQDHAELVATLAPGQHGAAVTGLDADKTYFFSVDAFNASNSATTDWVSATTLSQPIAVPANLALTSTDTKVDLSWSAAAGATGYRVYQWDGAQARLVGHTDAGTTHFSVTGLQPGTSYWFYVQAFNESNTASTAWKMVATTATRAPLLPPGNVTAHVIFAGQVELDWNASNRATGYMVYHWTGTSWEIAAALPGTVSSATVSVPVTGHLQWFMVLAYTDGFVESAASRMVSCTP
jgi:hypothetical protein